MGGIFVYWKWKKMFITAVKLDVLTTVSMKSPLIFETASLKELQTLCLILQPGSCTFSAASANSMCENKCQELLSTIKST